jgi:threonine dehydrogenase-like Zn-dependent dehydrogenase
MKAVVWHAVGDIRMDDVPEPAVEQPTDAVVRLTASAICGTDLHFVRGTMAGMQSGTILGPRRRRYRRATWLGRCDFDTGDPVVICPTIACGTCSPSQASEWAVQAVGKAGTIGIIGVYPRRQTRSRLARR